MRHTADEMLPVLANRRRSLCRFALRDSGEGGGRGREGRGGVTVAFPPAGERRAPDGDLNRLLAGFLPLLSEQTVRPGVERPLSARGRGSFT